MYEHQISWIGFTLGAIVLLVRTPSAIRVPRQRLLWYVVAAELGVLIFDLPEVKRAVDALVPVQHFNDLLKHLSALSAAALLLTFVIRLTASSEERRRRRTRWIGVATAVTFTVLVAIFLIANDQPTRPRFLGPAGEFSLLTVYWLVYLVYLVLGSCWAVVLFWRSFFRTPPGLLRAALGTLATGVSCGLLYVLLRSAMLVTASGAVAEWMSLFSSGALLFTPLGLSLATLDAFLNSLWDWRRRQRLYPLWRDLISAAPHLTLVSPSGRWLELLEFGATHIRLYRRVIEIRDAILILRDYTTPEIHQAAVAHVTSAVGAGLPAADVEPAVAACWIEAARSAKAAGVPPRPHRTAIAEFCGDGLDGEVELLLRISALRYAPLVRQFALAHPPAVPAERA